MLEHANCITVASPRFRHRLMQSARCGVTNMVVPCESLQRELSRDQQTTTDLPSDSLFPRCLLAFDCFLLFLFPPLSFLSSVPLSLLPFTLSTPTHNTSVVCHVPLDPVVIPQRISPQGGPCLGSYLCYSASFRLDLKIVLDGKQWQWQG